MKFLKFIQKLTKNDYLAAQLDMNEFCTSQNPPIHNLIFGSEDESSNYDQSQSSLQTALKMTDIMS